MGTESYFLITLGIIGIVLSIALVKSGYGKPVIGAISRTTRKAVGCLTGTFRRKI
jgi:hypothetical protein